ncbi:MAG: UMP kinase [Spirochaetota bacterium]|nr:MAG: UMP kinase [Spirochaetota bacterium]
MEKSKIPKYKRILLKISGEAIQGEDGIFDLSLASRIADEIAEIHGLGCEIGIVIGGGNIIRGEEFSRFGFDRNQSDYIGMLATVINGMLLESILLNKGLPAVIQSAMVVETLTEGIVLKRTQKYLNDKSVILFTGGTGNPYFTTDTAAALRACEIDADVLLKATKVDGVYDKDPVLYDDAVFHKNLTYHEVLYRDLKVIDMAAVAMCRDKKLPIIIFNIQQDGNIAKIVKGYDVGTTIKE